MSPDTTPLPVPGTTVVEATVPKQVISVALDPQAAIKPPAEKVQQDQKHDPSLPAKTTFQQDLTTAGQRHINVMWETTQKYIAIMVTAWTLVICAYCVIYPGSPNELRLLSFTLLSNVFFLVIGTYFQRTNHTKTGGVGPNERGR